MVKCPECGSDNYIYIKSDRRLLCKDCGFRPDYFGIPLTEDIKDMQQKLDLLNGNPPTVSLNDVLGKGKPVDPRFGRWLGKGVAKIGDKEFPLNDLRIVSYNPDGDPGQSYEMNKKPDTTDGEE